MKYDPTALVRHDVARRSAEPSEGSDSPIGDGRRLTESSCIRRLRIRVVYMLDFMWPTCSHLPQRLALIPTSHLRGSGSCASASARSPHALS